MPMVIAMDRTVRSSGLLFCVLLGLLLILTPAAADKPALSGITRRSLRHPVRVKTAAWLKANNAFGEDSPLVAAVTGLVEKEIGLGKGLGAPSHLGHDFIRTHRELAFAILLGPELVKSGRPTYLCGKGGQFLAVVVAEKHAKNLKVAPRGITLHRIRGGLYERLRTPLGTLSELKIKSVDAIDPTKNITGTVAFQKAIPYPRLKKHLEGWAFRLTCMPQKGSCTLYYVLDSHNLDKFLDDQISTLTFTFVPLGKRAHAGPFMVFLDLSAFSRPHQAGERTLVTNTLPIMLNVLATEPGDK